MFFKLLIEILIQFLLSDIVWNKYIFSFFIPKKSLMYSPSYRLLVYRCFTATKKIQRLVREKEKYRKKKKKKKREREGGAVLNSTARDLFV